MTRKAERRAEPSISSRRRRAASLGLMALPILRSPAHRKFQNPPEDFGIPT
jgi:hypothetical protein